jgi:hypothetical protein
MRRTIVMTVGAAALLAGSVAVAPALAAGTPRGRPVAHAGTTTKKKTAAKPQKRPFTTVEVGNRLSTSGPRFEDLYRVKSSPFGEGSVIRDAVLTNTTFPATGSDVAKTYDRGGRTFAKETFMLGTPNTDGVGTITGTGTCTSGTGTHLGETCTYAYQGTYDLITGVTQLTLSGSYTLGSKSKPVK